MLKKSENNGTEEEIGLVTPTPVPVVCCGPFHNF